MPRPTATTSRTTRAAAAGAVLVAIALLTCAPAHASDAREARDGAISTAALAPATVHPAAPVVTDGLRPDQLGLGALGGLVIAGATMVVLRAPRRHGRVHAVDRLGS